MWWAGGVALLFVIALLLTNFAPEDGTYDDWIYYGAGAVLATLPYAFWLGLLRSRLSEAELVAEENVRLDAELQARLVELRESRARIVEAGYAERRRVERDLHDGAQQRLVALALELRLARAKLDEDPATTAELLEGASHELAAATEELRELARGLHPPVLTDRGLVAALDALAGRSPLPVSVEAEVTDRAPPSAEAAAYFVVSEALTNVVRHAQAEHALVRSTVPTGGSKSRSTTMVAAAPTRPAAPDCAGCRTAWPHSTARWRSRADRAAGPSCGPSSRSPPDLGQVLHPGADVRIRERRGWDSNPRGSLARPRFQSCTLSRSVTSPERV